jgi:VIT1/CCC1 family predicted Fe2+/Mn2+ transporter
MAESTDPAPDVKPLPSAGKRLLPEGFDKKQQRLSTSFDFYDKKAESAHTTYSWLKFAQIFMGASLPVVAVVYKDNSHRLAIITAILGALITGIESSIQNVNKTGLDGEGRLKL